MVIYQTQKYDGSEERNPIVNEPQLLNDHSKWIKKSHPVVIGVTDFLNVDRLSGNLRAATGDADANCPGRRERHRPWHRLGGNEGNHQGPVSVNRKS